MWRPSCWDMQFCQRIFLSPFVWQVPLTFKHLNKCLQHSACLSVSPFIQTCSSKPDADTHIPAHINLLFWPQQTGMGLPSWWRRRAGSWNPCTVSRGWKYDPFSKRAKSKGSSWQTCLLFLVYHNLMHAIDFIKFTILVFKCYLF